ncbi:protein adenylyltransferase SelO [Nocardioides solisilvae]|uniref:protein adenylyltransferase SelO n=1 Tax=Nocardioides solisilvae TaxID=1542435 RepID=UPI0019525D4C|nr:YdiU family protein [Nocardioides solisilvae]
MSRSVTAPVTLASTFAHTLPELSVPWEAASAPDRHLLVLNDALATELGLDPDWLRSPAGLRLLTGEHVPPGARPVAQVYAGHQFGGWSPRLGDGRALLLGELAGPDGTLRDLHLKGSGRTPLARGGDGLAAVGPMLRELLVSEAMHALGVPTTRALAVVATGNPVQRETVLPGAVLARVAASHLRVGSLQFARATGDLELLRRVADHAIARHHPGAAEADHPHLALYAAVVAAQAELVAHWLAVGFVHGVMNTDNMTLSGETIDYGPCAFLDAHDPRRVFSSIDTGGRYAFGNQAPAAEWNLARLAEAMLPLFADDEQEAIERATEVLGTFRPLHAAARTSRTREKLGLLDGPGGTDGEAVARLGVELEELMAASRVDHTSFFVALGDAARGDREPARSRVLDLAALDGWLEWWLALAPDADLMDRTNPVRVPRNHLVEEALDAAVEGDLDPFERLLDAVTDPFGQRAGLERYAEPGLEEFDAGFMTFCGT